MRIGLVLEIKAVQTYSGKLNIAEVITCWTIMICWNTVIDVMLRSSQTRFALNR